VAVGLCPQLGTFYRARNARGSAVENFQQSADLPGRVWEIFFPRFAHARGRSEFFPNWGMLRRLSTVSQPLCRIRHRGYLAPAPARTILRHARHHRRRRHHRPGASCCAAGAGSGVPDPSCGRSWPTSSCWRRQCRLCRFFLDWT
jgi:hypothetical protein